MLNDRKIMVDDIPRFSLREHQVVRKHPELAVIFGSHILHAQPPGNRFNNAGWRSADDQVIRLLLCKIPRGNILLMRIPVSFNQPVKIFDPEDAEEFAKLIELSG